MIDNREQLFWEAQETINQLRKRIMCYCTPEIRTTFCKNCGYKMNMEINKLQARIKRLEAVREAAKSIMEVTENDQDCTDLLINLAEKLEACETQATEETNDTTEAD